MYGHVSVDAIAPIAIHKGLALVLATFGPHHKRRLACLLLACRGVFRVEADRVTFRAPSR